MVASKGPALAKRRNKLLQMCEIFPERKDFYVAQIEALDVALAEIQGCRRCGRRLDVNDTVNDGLGRRCRLIVAALDVQ